MGERNFYIKQKKVSQLTHMEIKDYKELFEKEENNPIHKQVNS